MFHHRLIASLFAAASVVLARADETLPNTTIEALPKLAPAPADNPSTPAKIALGRLLFFDPILSATRDVACATCHHPQHGWADRRSTALGVHARGLGPQRHLVVSGSLPPLQRNTPTLLNVAFNGITSGKPYDPSAAPMFWDNRVSSLESQALVPIMSLAEMRGDACAEASAIPAMIERVNAIAEYRQRFREAFDSAVSSKGVTQAIAAYERTLIAMDSPFDRFMRGDKTAMTQPQQHGMAVFQKAGCALCHNGPMLSDYKLHALGVTDASTARGEFRTPSLRNLKHTAPYMHHGSLKTLDDVLLFYDLLMDHIGEALDGGDATTLPPLDPLLQRLNMLPEDHEPLVAFLDALNSDGIPESEPTRVPSGLPVAGLSQARKAFVIESSVGTTLGLGPPQK